MSKLLTCKLPTGEIVLAKQEKLLAWSANSLEELEAMISPIPLRYGNQTQAKTKIKQLEGVLREEGYKAGVVKQGGRFLILLWRAPIDHAINQGPGRIFATVSGPRMNMRNRHDHPQNTTDERYSYDT